MRRLANTQDLVHLKRLPAPACTGCNKCLPEVGGYRITAQKARGTALTESRELDATRVRAHQPIQLFSGVEVYMAYWGEAELWTKAAIARAKQAYMDGQKPWFCQICAMRQCHACGAPVNYPAGSDIIRADGELRYFAIFSVDLGCGNTHCKRYTESIAVSISQDVTAQVST